jgi:hypothetical protein
MAVPLLMLLNDTITVANGTTGDDDAGNVLADNGNGTDTQTVRLP